MEWQKRYADKRKTLDEAVALIPRGKHIFVGSGFVPMERIHARVLNETDLLEPHTGYPR